MNIQDALKETGKASRDMWGDDSYIFIGEYSTFETSEETGYFHTNICDKNWKPYHDKKEIRPENAGELWEYESIKFMICGHEDGGLHAACAMAHFYKNMYSDTFNEIIHNQNGWTRLYPPVEDEIRHIRGM